jgi:hypothetical protein
MSTMSISEQSPSEHLLACMNCETQQPLDLNPTQMIELGRDGQLHLLCPACGTITSWCIVETDRQKGSKRRSSSQKLRIRVRCSSPGLIFTEDTTTASASLHEASFISSRNLPEGTPVHVILPFCDGDPETLERPARVVWVEAEKGNNKIGVRFAT